MQFVWVYVDELIGKGLDFFILAKLLFYISTSLVPMALPLSILLASIMLFGKLGENNELTAIKSCGMSLFSLMKPLLLVMIFISYVSYIFANYVIPYSNFKSKNLIYNIREKKPTVSIVPGVFMNEIEGHSIRVGKKYGKKDQYLEDIIIYKNNKCISAKRGKMEFDKKIKHIVVELYDGFSFEVIENKKRYEKVRSSVRTKFKKSIIYIDISSMDNINLNQNRIKDSYSMLSINQLHSKIDSLDKSNKEIIDNLYDRISYDLNDNLSMIEKIELKDTMIKKFNPIKFIDTNKNYYRHQIIDGAISNLNNKVSIIDSDMSYIDNKKRSIINFELEIYKKYSLPIMCFIFFLIGSSFGSIITKGGFGMPVMISIITFMAYHVMFMIGQKMSQQSVITPFFGRFYPVIVMALIGTFLVKKAMYDSIGLRIDFYRIFRNKKKDE